MSGSFVPWAKLYDGFFFTPEHQPCENRYRFEKSLQEEDGFTRFSLPLDSFDKYLEILENGDKFKTLLQPEKIEIVEKSPEEISRKTRRQMIGSSNEPTSDSDVEDSDVEAEINETVEDDTNVN